jgi:hypothetical protein
MISLFSAYLNGDRVVANDKITRSLYETIGGLAFSGNPSSRPVQLVDINCLRIKLSELSDVSLQL